MKRSSAFYKRNCHYPFPFVWPLPYLSRSCKPWLLAPAQIGWKAWFRSIDLVTPQQLKGEELLLRTRGWWTVEPKDVAEVVKKHGRLIVGEEGELMAEFNDQNAVEALSAELKERFGDQVLLSP